MESCEFEEAFAEYITIKGRYEKGKLILEEEPPVEWADVFVIVLQEQEINKTSSANQNFDSYKR